MCTYPVELPSALRLVESKDSTTGIGIGTWS